MEKRLKRLLGKKGLTLVEILVVLVVSSILLGIAMGMLMPVTRLMNSLKGNAHMDATCNTVNEYIRGSLQGATSISIYTYPDDGTDIDGAAMNTQWEAYQAKAQAEGYKVKALAVLRNYNDDYRLYDFGDVTNLSDPRFFWGASFHPTSLKLLVDNRDGGGRGANGLNFNEFHRFDAFNEEFYSNGADGGEVNYSFQMYFGSTDKAIDELDDDGNVIGTINGVNYLTVKSQIFKRTGRNWFDFSEGVLHKDATFEPTNQLRSLSFKLFNGNAIIDSSKKVNKVVMQDGVEMIDTSDGMSGVIVLYLVKDFDFTPPAAP